MGRLKPWCSIVMKIWGSLSPGRFFGFLLATWMTFVATASAADLVGRVTNGTTNKPAAGDEVVLLSVSEGSAKESVRAKTDSGASSKRMLLSDEQATLDLGVSI